MFCFAYPPSSSDDREPSNSEVAANALSNAEATWTREFTDADWAKVTGVLFTMAYMCNGACTPGVEKNGNLLSARFLHQNV